jgi:hypothetical protein
LYAAQCQGLKICDGIPARSLHEGARSRAEDWNRAMKVLLKAGAKVNGRDFFKIFQISERGEIFNHFGRF